MIDTFFDNDSCEHEPQEAPVECAARFLEELWQTAAPESQTNKIAPPPEDDELPPAPSAQQIQAMYADAAQGRFAQTAGTMAIRAFVEDPQNGLGNMRTAANVELERLNSQYRMRVATVQEPNSNDVTVYVVLQRNGENLNDLITDAHRNGARSQYANRAIQIRVQQPAPRIDA